jgi:glutamate:Na+ symporter, ESS family
VPTFVFLAMGGTYEAAVITACFGGAALGAAPTAFIILSLVPAFFLNIASAAVIGFMAR